MTALRRCFALRSQFIRSLVAVCVALATAACDRGSSAVDAASADFGGWWTWEPAPDDFGPVGPPVPLLHAPFKPEVTAAIRDTVSKVFDTSTSERPDDAALGIDTRALCEPPRFTGFNGVYGAYFEILLTPGRATIGDETGLLRRVDMTGKALPAVVTESRVGTSVGHWDGATLVVETVGMDSETPFFGPFKFGKGMRTVERFTVTGPDVMEVALEMTAPELFDGVFERTFTFHRDPNHEFTELSVCERDDRSIDHSTGKQRFDMTPPDDLPPPPSE